MKKPRQQTLAVLILLCLFGLAARSYAQAPGTGPYHQKPVQSALQPPLIISSQAQRLIPGTTILAASCGQADVQTAIDAASGGDTVLVPAGHCTWTTHAAGTPAITIADKGLTLVGAGVDQTTITDGTGYAAFEQALTITIPAGKRVRVSGFTFQGGHSQEWHGFVNIWGGSTCCGEFRLDQVRFTGTINHAIEIGRVTGVIDHCLFDGDVGGVLVKGEYPGDAAWQSDLALGSANAVFIEDCTFNFSTPHRAAVDAQSGGRFVFRHNTLHNTFAVNHGTETGYPERGVFTYEIYENEFTSPSDWFTAIFLRGGTGVIFNNSATGYGDMIVAANYRSCSAYGDWGRCDGASPYDGNQQTNGYPCYDQIGRSTDTGPGTAQASEPLYEWNNILEGENADVVVHWGCPEVALHIQENRDFFNDTLRPGYTPYPYPHPLTQELDLAGTAAHQSIFLTWTLDTSLPLTTTWDLVYLGPVGDQPSPILGLPAATRAYTLTGLTNYAWYTITLNTTPPLLTDTIRLMPTDQLDYLPIIYQDP